MHSEYTALSVSNGFARQEKGVADVRGFLTE